MVTTAGNIPTVVGFVSSVIGVLLGFSYLATILSSFIQGDSSFPPSEPVQLAGAIISLGIGIDLVVLMAAIQWHLPPERQILAEIALIFLALLCVSTSINRFVQLSVLPQYRHPENPQVLALIHPYGPKSIMFAVESLGWGLFYGLGVLFAGLAIGGSGLEGWISGLFILGGALSLLYAVGVILKQPILSLLGFPAWSVLATITAILLAIRFWSLL